MPGIDGVRRPALLPVPGQQVIRPMFRSLGIAASGLSAQRQRMETIAQNVANADVTGGPNGTPYKRRTTLLETATQDTAMFNTQGSNALPALPAKAASGSRNDSFGTRESGDTRRAIEVPVFPNGVNPGPVSPTGQAGQFGVAVSGVVESQSEGRLVYQPGHPDADASGYVRYPDVDTTQEMVNMLDAKRIYEANASVFQAVKSMLRAALDI